MSEWKKNKLGELCIIEKGKIGITESISGKYPFVALSKELKTHNEYHFDTKAVIVPLVSSTGHGHKSMKRIFYQEGKFAIGTILCALIPKCDKTLSAEYLYTYLDFNKERELVSRMKGMANVTLPIKALAEVEVPLPPIHHQNIIVAKLKELKNKTNIFLEESSKQIEIINKLRQAILKEAMEGKLVKQNPKDGNARNLLEQIKKEKEKLIKEKKIPKSNPLPPIQPEEIPYEIPDNWAWCRLGEIIQVISGFGFNSNDFKKNSDGIKTIKITNAGIGEIIETNECLPFSFKDKYNSYLVYEGDLVLALTRPYISDGLKISMCNKLYNEALLNQRVCVLRSHLNNEIIRAYLYRFMRSDIVLNHYKNMFQNKSQQPNLKIDHIINLFFPLPPLSEQIRIVKKLNDLMKYCDELEQSISSKKDTVYKLLQVSLKEALEPKTGDKI